jgi:hypothetical protein
MISISGTYLFDRLGSVKVASEFSFDLPLRHPAGWWQERTREAPAARR